MRHQLTDQQRKNVAAEIVAAVESAAEYFDCMTKIEATLGCTVTGLHSVIEELAINTEGLSPDDLTLVEYVLDRVEEEPHQ